MKYMIIVNPKSGTSKRPKDYIAAMAQERLGAADVRLTERAGHATELAAEAAAKGYDAVLAVGGDGTVNETACGLIGSQTTLGIIACGSGNGLARHLHLSMKPEKAIEQIAEGHIVSMDYCTANGTPFFCTCGMGFDAAVSDRFASDPTHRGLVNYVKCAIVEFFGYKPEHYVIETEQGRRELDAFIIAGCNASQYGNDTFIAPAASVTDGKMDLTVIHRGSRLGYLGVGLRTMLGTLKQSAGVDCLRTDYAIIERKAGPGHRDGEPVELGERVELRCHPAGLKVFTAGQPV